VLDEALIGKNLVIVDPPGAEDPAKDSYSTVLRTRIAISAAETLH
jgi:hypothetical protein